LPLVSASLNKVLWISRRYARLLVLNRIARIGRNNVADMEIKVFNNNVEKALKVAKKKLAGEGLFRELKRRRFYEKPSVRKKAKQREAQRRRQKWLAKRKME
jgi:small subunit ribosomal protein S21